MNDTVFSLMKIIVPILTNSDSTAIYIWARLDMQRRLFKSQPLAFMFRHFPVKITQIPFNQILCKQIQILYFFLRGLHDEN